MTHEVLAIPTNVPHLELRELATPEDDRAYFESIVASRLQLMRYAPETVEKYQTLDSVREAREDPEPGKLRLGLWGSQMFAGSINIYTDAAPAIIGYWVDSRHAGKGYATAAVQALTRFALDSLQLEEIVGHVDTDNRASQRVLEKAGYTLVRGRGFNPHKYAITK